MFKKLLCLLSAFCLAFTVWSANAESISVSAKTAVLMNSATLSVYYNKNMHKKMPMASTTKIMTAVVLCENAKLDQKVKITDDMVLVEGSSMGLRKDDWISYYGLLCGMLLASGNDAANSVALSLSGSIEDFALLMNKKADEIGMKDTNFVTPSGLDDEQHYSTAYDMALLAAYALKIPAIRDVVSQKSIVIEFGNPVHKQRIKNHNRLLSIYSDAVGVKTGFTKKSGRCLVSAAERDNTTLIAVTLNAPDDWDDHCNLYDYGFSILSDYDISELVKLDGIALVGSRKQKVRPKVSKKIIKATKDDIKKITYKPYLPKYIYATSCFDDVGRVDYYCNGNYLTTSAVTVEHNFDVKNKKLGVMARMFQNFFSLLRF